MKVGTALNVSNNGYQSIRIDQRVERDIIKVELPRHGDENAVEMVLRKGAIGSNSKLAAENHIESVRQAHRAS